MVLWDIDLGGEKLLYRDEKIEIERSSTPCLPARQAVPMTD